MTRFWCISIAVQLVISVVCETAEVDIFAAAEDDALLALQTTGFSLSAIDSLVMDELVHRGWHKMVQAVVERSRAGDEAEVQRVAFQVRHAVQVEKNRLDDLIRALDRNYEHAVVVKPAMQWAQNSTHVFLAVKFAQRWNAPGALEVRNETVDISECCFNLTAFGEHSMIRRKYFLSFGLYQSLVPASSVWHFAAAGRLTATLQKNRPANWARLMSAEEPKNLGIWRDMKDKWSAELMQHRPETTHRKAGEDSQKVAKSKKKRSRSDDEDDVDEVLDRELDIIGDCEKSSYKGTSVAELCDAAWEDIVKIPKVHRVWLIQFYNSDVGGETTTKFMPVWRRLADVFPSSVPGGRVGAVDCAHHKLCATFGVTTFPHVRRYVDGVGTPWSRGFEESIEAFVAFGERDEL